MLFTGNKSLRKILGLCVWSFDISPSPSEKNTPLHLLATALFIF